MKQTSASQDLFFCGAVEAAVTQQVSDALNGKAQEVVIIHHCGEVLTGVVLGKLIHRAVGVSVSQCHGSQTVPFIHAVLPKVNEKGLKL